jgi:CubicO group peptidase (beta-lactamase class C family)
MLLNRELARLLSCPGFLQAVLTAVLGIALALVSASAALAQPPIPRAVSPAAPGLTSQLDHVAIRKAAAELPRLHSILVSWRGALVLEQYYNGARATRLENIKSASKSIISALLGIAIERKLIADVRQPIAPFFADLLAGDGNAAKRLITIENLLTMQSGLTTTSNRNYGAWVQSANWVRHALGRPLEHRPGTEMEYSTGNTHLLSAIITKASGTSTWQFAQDNLARPLGLSLAQWPRDPQGVYFGGNDMLLTPRQMIAFGELYLHRGRANGRQVVPAAWVDASFVPRTRSNWSDQTYGYGWWMREMAGVQTYYAWGFGGQFIFVIPELDAVIASTSAATVADDRRSHRRTVDELIEGMVIAPLASVK